MTTTQKLPPNHTESVDAITIPGAPQVFDSPVLVELLNDRAKLFKLVDAFTEVTSLDDTAGMQAAKELRLKLVKNRTGLDNEMDPFINALHKKHKAACAMRKPLLAENAMAEAYLKQSENYAVIYEASRKAELKTQREKLLAPYVTADQLTLFQLGEMDESTWEQTFAGMKAAYEARVAAEKQAVLEEEQRRVADRIRAELAERTTRRVRELSLYDNMEGLDLDNMSEEDFQEVLSLAKVFHAEKLETEAKERKAQEAESALLREEKRVADEAAAKEREKHAAELKRQADEQEKINARIRKEQAESDARLAAATAAAEALREEKRQQEAEVKRKEEEERVAKEKAARAPDKEKITAYIAQFVTLLDNAPKVSESMEHTLDVLTESISDALQTTMKQLVTL